jgi:hypothetical protein
MFDKTTINITPVVVGPNDTLVISTASKLDPTVGLELEKG